MALLAYTGFDHINSTSDLANGPLSGFYTSPNFSFSVVSGRSSGKAVSMNAVSGINTLNGAAAFKSFGLGISTVLFGAAIQFPQTANLGKGVSVGFGLSNGSTPQITFRIDASGALTLARGGIFSATTLTNVYGSLSAASAWNYYEVLATIHASTGSVQLKINGNTVLNVSGLNTSADGTAAATSFHMIGSCPNSAGPDNGSMMIVDDLYVLDTTGSAPYNTFLGDVRILTKFPSSNGTYSDFTPLTSTNVSQVSETAMDSSTSYTSSSTTNAKDTFTAATLPYTPTTIYATQITNAASLSVGAGRTISGYLKSGATELAGTALGVTTTYTYLSNIFTTDPNTTVAWTSSGVNATEFGYKLVS